MIELHEFVEVVEEKIHVMNGIRKKRPSVINLMFKNLNRILENISKKIKLILEKIKLFL